MSAASGITQFAEGEPKCRNYDNERFHQWMEGGNEVREANVVTLRSKGEKHIDAAENLSGSRTKSATDGEAPLPIRAAARLPIPAPVGRFFLR